MRTLLTKLLVLFLFLQSCISYDELIDQGKRQFDEGNIVEAKSSFEKALEKDSTKADAYYGLGFLLAEECRSKHSGCEYAVNFFTQVIKIDSNFRHVFYNRANCFMELENYTAALHDLNIQQSIEKEDADYHRNRSFCYLQIGDTSNAIVFYKKSISLDFNKKSEYMEQLIQRYNSRPGN